MLIYNIIMLKNANNLILELGPYAFMSFINDIKEELLQYMTPNSKKAIDAGQILKEFTPFDKAEL